MSNPTMISMTRSYHNINTVRLTSGFTSYFKFFLVTLFAVIALILVSCEEDPLTIGSEILPPGDFVNIKSTDTVTVFSYTVYDEAVRSDEQAYSFLGSIIDPHFGITTTDFVTQLRLGYEWEKIPFVIDSVKLNLVLVNVKGSVNGTNYLRISEIAEELHLDSAYYSNREVPLTGYTVPDILLPKLKPDSVNYLTLRIPTEFGNYLTRDTSMLFHDNSRPDFRSFFKGMKFSLISTDPIFLTLSLAPPEYLGGASNYFTLYMSSGETQKVYHFILDAKSNNARLNRHNHDFDAATEEIRVRYVNEGIKDSLTYVQGLNGVYTRILLPGLEDIKNDPSLSDIAVNRARLIVPLYKDAYSGKLLPSQLLVRYKTSTGEKFYVPDYDPYNVGFFDGKIDTTANVCRFNIASFVQGYLEDTSDKIKPELEIFVTPSDTRNVILKANSSSTPVKFEFTYTKF
jgi:hypothetical protein